MKGFLLFLLTLFTSQASTTIDPASANAYGANISWVNCRGDGANGAVIGEFSCSGYLHSANCGWIHLGDGTPTNGINHQNNSATDYGVNTEQYLANGVVFEAKLRGYAYGANIGWVKFGVTGNPRVNLATGQLLGYAWGANVGWISLGEAGVTVSTTAIAAGADSDSDTVPDAWERAKAGNLATMHLASDSDKGGVSDPDEYAADTNPFDATSKLRIIAFVGPRNVAGTRPFETDVTWTSQPTRWYEIETDADLDGPWQIGADQLVPAGSTTFKRFNDPNLVSIPAARFYRVRPKLPLEP